MKIAGAGMVLCLFPRGYRSHHHLEHRGGLNVSVVGGAKVQAWVSARSQRRDFGSKVPPIPECSAAVSE